MDCSSCDCLQISNINQCAETLDFDLGMANADITVIFNITGRSKRIYQIGVATDSNGEVSIPTGVLPNGYLSVFTVGKYKVWFNDSESGEILIIDGNENTCIEFKASSIIDVVIPFV